MFLCCWGLHLDSGCQSPADLEKLISLLNEVLEYVYAAPRDSSEALREMLKSTMERCADAVKVRRGREIVRDL